jgi:hypothetical protein
MPGKRAPGAGRKPRGPIKGKSETFTTRITPAVKTALEREAQRHNRSLSQEIELRLRYSIEQPKRRERALGVSPHADLGIVVAQLAAGVTAMTGENWRKDAFSFEAVKSAIEFALSLLSPTGAVKVPPAVEHRALRLQSHHGDQLRDPDGIGTAVAAGFWEQLLVIEEPPFPLPKNEHYADDYYLLPRLRKNLDLKPREGIGQ